MLAKNESRMVMLLLGALLLGGCGNQDDRSFEPGPLVEAPGWPTYAGLETGTRYSPLNQINRSNAGDLDIAWIYNTGHLERAPHFNDLLGFQATPILLPEEAGRHLVLCDPDNRIIALDPATGRERWAFDPEIDLSPHAGRFNCRGVTYWRDPESSAWHVGGANAWTTFSWENESDLVFIPTASPSPDFYGGKRPGDNLYGNSLVVLRASTGELVWHYQILKFPASEIPSA